MKNEYHFKNNEVHIVIKDKEGNEHIAIIDSTDFDRVDSMSNTWGASRSKSRESIYAQCWFEGRAIGLHRWLLNPSADKVVDHINHNTLDNRRCNLRMLTHAENLQNHKGASKNSKSGVRGVYWDRTVGKWMAQYKLNGRPVNLGRFETIEEARIVVERERKKVMKYSS